VSSGMMAARSGTGLDNVDCSVHAVVSSSESRRMLMDVVNRLLSKRYHTLDFGLHWA
jgi:hypothetical protein